MTASRVVEITERSRKLTLDRGFLVVHGDARELGRVALDDVSALIVTSPAVSYTNPVVTALAERGAVVAVCGAKYLPVAWLLPVAGHHAQTRIMSAQSRAPKKLVARMWQAIVKAKILAQADALEATGREGAWLRAFAARVGSNDQANVEAQAAARYWPAMFGDDFRRDRGAYGVNELLNYGYTVLRSAAARAIVAAGLHPSIGLHHRRDPLSLADDLMEPVRPLVDVHVHELASSGVQELTLAARHSLVGLLAEPLDSGGTATLRLRDIAIGLASAYLTGRISSRGARGGVRSANDNGGR
jgi:CRISP-associated protein Cas1